MECRFLVPEGRREKSINRIGGRMANTGEKIPVTSRELLFQIIDIIRFLDFQLTLLRKKFKETA